MSISLSSQGLTDVTDMVKNALVSGVAGASINNALKAGRKSVGLFTNVPAEPPLTAAEISLLVILIVIVIAIYILSYVAIYKLTNGSSLQTILYFLFGSFYLTPALIYYAFNGYTLRLQSINSNNNTRRN